MKVESSAGIVVYFESKKERLYLLLHYKKKSDYWDFTKGNIKAREKAEEAALRECKEETGLDIEIMPGFKERVKWFYTRGGERIFKQVFYFIGKAHSRNVKISFEHIGFEWLNFKEAMTRLTFKNSRDLLEKAEAYISEREAA